MYGVITTEMLARSFMILVFMFLMLTSGPSLVYMCCTDEEQPISDCSYSYHDSNNKKDNVSCEIRGSPKILVYDTCLRHFDWSEHKDDIPGRVQNLTTKYYYTTCSPTVQHSKLAASSCHSHCNQDNETFYLGLNITFKAVEWTSEHLKAILISLREGAKLYERCIQFDLSRNSLTTDALTHHYFHYDGFIGLQPGGDYLINVIALPTDSERSNKETRYLEPPLETCWKPELLYHDTPFAVNITLFQDTIYYFEGFDVYLGQLMKEIYFSTSEAYEIDGKLGINIFECQQSTSGGEYLRLIIIPKECPYCVPYENEVHIQEAPPSFLDCPRDEIIYEVKLGRYFEGDMVKGINWTVPTPIFQNKCQHGINSTHTPMESVFEVGRKTPVTYQAWQYSSVAECTFEVHVKLAITCLSDMPGIDNAVGTPNDGGDGHIDIDDTGSYECEENFTPSGNPGIACNNVNDQGEWGSTDFNCSPITCLSDMPGIDNAVGTPNDGGDGHIDIDDTGSYECEENFTPSGNPGITCNNVNDQGEWGSTDFSCSQNTVSLALIIAVSCSAGILLIIILLIILYCIYTKRSSEIHTDEPASFRPIPSGEKHGIPMSLLHDYQDSQPSLNSSKINGSQGLKYPKSTKQVNLPSTSGCYSSLPSIMTGDHATSGYMSIINANSDQPRHLGEVGMALIRRENMHRCNSEDEDGDSDDSLDIQVSLDDPGPMSMEYHLT